MSKRKIKPKRNPDFVYENPIVRRKTKKNDESKLTPIRKATENPENLITKSGRSLSPSPQLTTVPEALNPQSTLTSPLNPIPIPSPNHPIPPNPSDTALYPEVPTPNNNLDELLSKIYKSKNSPAAYSAAVQKYIDKNYSLSLHKQRRKKFR